MSANPLFLTQRMTTICCYKEDCGVSFAIPERLEEELRRTHASFYCPHGHSQAFVVKSKEEKLQEALAWQKSQTTLEQELKLQARGQRDRAIRKLERRVKRLKRGRCPVSRCKARGFDKLSDHLKKAHRKFRR